MLLSNCYRLCALLVVFLAGATQADTAVQNSDAAYHEGGRKLYNYRCYYCHGYSGDAKTLASSFMQPPPRNFIATDLDDLSREAMIKTVRDGRAGTAMTSFTYYLSPEEIEQVVDFVRHEFMRDKKHNTRYHSDENGWPNHDRYRIAYPFAAGDIALDTPQEQLSEQQREGLRLFMTSCVSCHDRAAVNDEGDIWQARAVSWPRNNFSYSDVPKETVDGVSKASVYATHDVVPEINDMTAQQREGQALYQVNCAFCHAADGTGANWIGSFLEPRPRDLSNKQFMAAINRDYLRRAIREGLTNTSMPAWKDVLSEEEIEAIIAYIDRAFATVGGETAE